MKKYFNITCEWCGDKFTAKVKTTKYCSRKCIGAQTKAKNAKNSITRCEWCNTEFIPSSYKQRFCTTSCAAKWRMDQPGMRENLSEFWTDYEWDEERNLKISESLKDNQHAKGSKRTEEQLQKQRERMPRGKDHWLYGKLPNEKVLANLRYCNENRTFTAEQLKRKSEVQMGEKNSFYGKHHTEETIAALSEKRCQLIIENEGINPFLKQTKKGKFYSTKNNCEFAYDSSYEIQAYKILEKIDSIVSYKRCNFSIKYTHENKIKRYIPDLITTNLNGDKKIIEIKPKGMLKVEKNKCKFKALRVYCNENNLNCRIWTEGKLFKDDIEYRNLLKELNKSCA